MPNDTPAPQLPPAPYCPLCERPHSGQCLIGPAETTEKQAMSARIDAEAARVRELKTTIPRPPAQHEGHRWHWLREPDGDLFLADWHYREGWHGGWSGKAVSEDMDGWAYVAPALPPMEAANA